MAQRRVLSLVVGLVLHAALLSNTLPAIPDDTQGLDLDGAYLDLHKITRQPHPLNSHANDVVRAYILNRLQTIAAGHPHVHVIDDLVSNASYAEPTRAMSFEGSNILVKIDGTEPEFETRGGVLFSAHFDSVSTAPGVTDDGIGVVTLIALVKYLTEHRTRRPAIFNINNGEEDGLNGAHAFLQHPWATIPDTFINLEGAAAGGCPLLFRASSLSPVLSFKNPSIPHPHGNVLSADAFVTGIIKSRTDYSIYNTGTHTSNGQVKAMQGIDFAFYQGRSKYHTKYDSIPGASHVHHKWFGGEKGAKESLWVMMQGVRGAGMSLLDDDETHVQEGEGEPPVYFDILRTIFIVLTQKALFKINLALLVLGPILLSGIYLVPRFLARAVDSGSDSTVASSLKSTVIDLHWTQASWWKWGKFWVAFIIGIHLNVGMVWSFVKINPFIAYSHPYWVVTSLLSLNFLIFTLILSSRSSISHLGPTQQLPLQLSLYILTYTLLIGSTTLMHRADVGGFYFVSVWNACVGFGLVCGLGERALALGRKGTRKVGTGSVVEEDEGNGPEERDATERTPLIHTDGPSTANHGKLNTTSSEAEGGGSPGWWTLPLLQLLITVPLPLLLILQVLILLIDALYQTLADGGPAIVVYAPLSLLSFLLTLVVSPYTTSISTSSQLTSLVFLAFVGSTLLSWSTFPFSQDAPLVVFFHQNVTVDLGLDNFSSGVNSKPQGLTSLTGVSGYVERVVESIPSSWGKDVQCSSIGGGGRGGGLLSCAWESGDEYMPSPIAGLGSSWKREGGRQGAEKWIKANATRLSPTSALIKVKGTNTRSCRVFFDMPIVDYEVYGPDVAVEEGNVFSDDLKESGSRRSRQPKQSAWPIPEGGIKELWMMSRTWERQFVVEVQWNASVSASSEHGPRSTSSTQHHRGVSKLLDSQGESEIPFSGLVGCAWSEYESATIGLGLDLPPDVQTGAIPAYEEVLTYLPKWSVSTKFAEALVLVTGRFEV